MESLVEEMLRLRGFAYERNVRVRGRSGSLHEVDFLVRTSAGLVVYEVKNYERPAPKEVVVKAYEVARDLGAVGVVVVSSSGFTDGAVKVARALGVELMDLDDVVNAIEAAREAGEAVYLDAAVDVDEARRVAEKLAQRRLLLIRVEEVESVECVYVPFYYFEGEVALGGGRYARVDLASSGYTGLPLAAPRRGLLVDAAGELARLPPDTLRVYASIAGRTLSARDAEAALGRARWRRLASALEPLGLLERVSRRPAVYRVRDARPPLGALEGAAATFTAARARAAPARGCARAPVSYSPGAALSLLSALYSYTSTGHRLLYAPVYVARLARGRVYRLAYVAGWAPGAPAYRPAVDIRLSR